jgi:hypothetical protein
MHSDAENTRSPRPPGLEIATSRRAAKEQQRAVTDALIQTATDLKDVGKGVTGGYVAWKLTQSKQPPEEK